MQELPFGSTALLLGLTPIETTWAQQICVLINSHSEQLNFAVDYCRYEIVIIIYDGGKALRV